MKLKDRIKDLEERYNVSIDEYMELYKNKASKEVMAEALGISYFTIRTIASELRLKFAKKNRANGYVAYMVETAVDIDNQATIDEAPYKENEYLNKKLENAERQLIRTKDELNRYKRTFKADARASTFEERILTVVEQGMDKVTTPTIPFVGMRKTTSYAEHTQLIILSDHHVDEIVSHDDIGQANMYNWDIMQQRLGIIFSELLNAYRGENKLIVAMLGDQFTGLLYDAMEHKSKTLGEAVTEYSLIISTYLKSMSHIYEEIEVVILHGNHGRLSQDKKSAGYGTNNFEYIMAMMLKGLLKESPNVIFNISTTGLAYTTVSGSVIGMHHGDFFKSVGDTKHMRVKEHFKQSLGVEPNVILQGHAHVYSNEQMPRNGYYITNASLIGQNGYSHINGFIGKEWGQVIMSFLPSGSVENVRLVGAV